MKKKFTFILALFISFSIFAAEGDSCDNPITANMGENSATVENGNQWFMFTATTAGDYIISNDGYLSEDDMVMLRVYSDCDTEIDTLYEMGGYGSKKMVSLAADESILFMWEQEFSHIAFTFNIYNAENGDAFHKPIVISAPKTITFPADKDVLYYSYTVSDSAVVILSESDNDYYTTLYKTNGEEIAYGYMDERKYHLAPGTYIIRMKSYIDVSFDWTLTERDLILGEFCYAPIVLTESSETDFGGNKNTVYYSFTAQENGKICGANMLTSNVIVYDECDGNELFTAWETTSFCYAVESGNNYIIYLSTGYGIDEFAWDFIVADGTGESCDNPIIIDAYGTISTPEGSGLLYYKYTCTDGGAFKISDGEDIVNNKVELYANCVEVANGFNHELAIGYEGEILYEAEVNEEFIIVWDIGGGGQPSKDGMFEWSILADDTPGLSCNNPIVLTELGDVQYEAGNPELYYSYTVSRDCRLELSHGDDFSGTFAMYLDCEDDQFDQHGYGGEMVVYAEKGVTYILKWEPSYDPYNTFTWTINEVDYWGGEVCKYPEVISEPGDIEFVNTEGEWYYSYTATIDGALKITDNDNESLVEIYSDCDYLNGLEFSTIGELTTGGTEGETYIIEWTNREAAAFTWTLTETVGVPGETCNKPIVIESLGEQGTPVEFEVPGTTAYTYYSYTSDIDQMLIVTDNDNSHGVAIDSTCDFNTAAYGNSGELSTEIIANTTYIIRWSTWIGTSYSWTADSRDLLPGETPNSAIIIPEPGNVEYLDARAELYYKYTATQDAAIEMTSDNADAYVNNGSLKYVLAGETILIQWINPAETAFTWNLIERDIIDGETCSSPIEITTAGDISYNAQLTKVYYSYSPTQNSTIKVSDNENSHSVYVSRGCNYSSYYNSYNGEIAFEATTSENIIISWNNNSMDEFTWNIVEETPITGETANEPIVIDEPKTVSYQGIDKGLVRNYYSYTPAVKQQVNLSLANSVMVWDAATGDTISEVYYEATGFVANKNSTYIIVWELSGGSIDTLTLAATELYEETSTVTFNISDSYGAIVDASIAINETSLTTDASGIATIELEDGTYNYTITASNYESVTGQVIVNGSAITVTTVLFPVGVETYTITFDVSDTNGAIADASIAINETLLNTNAGGNATIELEDGTYNYTITATNYENLTGEVVVNGSAITVTIVLTPVGISDKNQVTVKIYPNPTKENITIESSQLIKQVSLFTIDGKQIVMENKSNNSLNIKHLKNGIYLLQINTDGNIITKRIIKE